MVCLACATEEPQTLRSVSPAVTDAHDHAAPGLRCGNKPVHADPEEALPELWGLPDLEETHLGVLLTPDSVTHKPPHAVLTKC